MLYDVALFSPIYQSQSVISIYIPSLLNLPPTSPHSSPLGLHRELGWVPCAIQQFLLAIYSTHDMHIYTRICQCHSLNLSHPLLPPLCPQVHSLCLHLPIFPVNRFIRTVFLDCLNVVAFRFRAWWDKTIVEEEKEGRSWTRLDQGLRKLSW